MVVAILFALAAFFFAPIALIIPSAATAPALLIVGVLMLKGAAEIDWSDIEVAIPAFLTIAIMPFAYSISDGIAFGFIFYSLIKLIGARARKCRCSCTSSPYCSSSCMCSPPCLHKPVSM